MSNSSPVIYLPVSLGEALDKFSILQIKQSKILDPGKIKDISKEISAILPIIKEDLDNYNYQYRCLKWINQQLWDMSDQIRLLDHTNPQYQIMCVRLIEENDARFRIKNKINNLANSTLKEQKSYNHRCANIVSETNNYQTYREYNALIRYLAFKFDQIIIKCQTNDIKQVTNMFKDDPTILVKVIALDETPPNAVELFLDKNLYTKFYVTPEFIKPLESLNEL